MSSRSIIGRAALLAILCQSYNVCAQVPHDLTGDGISDFVLVSIKQNNTLGWEVFDPSNSSASTAADSFGSAGNNLITSNWTSSTVAQLGYVSKDTDGGIVWKIKDGGTFESDGKKFGSGKNLVISGADFNGNGFGDAAVVKGTRITVRTDFFTSSADAVSVSSRTRMSRRRMRKVKIRESTLSFKRSGDIVFFADPNGNGDWIGSLRSPGQNARVVLRNVFTGARKVFSVGAVGTSKRPQPLRQTSGGDLLAFISQNESDTDVVFKDMNGATIASHTFNGTEELVIGNFSNDHSGDEMAIQTETGFDLYNPVSNVAFSITTPSGIPVDQINIHSFSTTGSGGGKNEVLNPRDGGYGFLWKPISDSTGKLAVHLPSRYTGNIASCQLVGAGDTLIENGVYGGDGNGDASGLRALFRFSKPGSAYPAGLVVLLRLDDGGTVRWTIDRPSQRID